MGQLSAAQKAGPRDAASKAAQQRLSVLELARELGNVAEACRHPPRLPRYSDEAGDALCVKVNDLI